MSFNAAAEAFLETPRARRTLTVAALPHSRDGSSYYRIWLPFHHLKQQSLHAYVVYPDDPNQDVPDVTVLQRPAGIAGMQIIERLVGQTRIVYEVDDNMLEVDPSGLPHLYDERVRETIRRCVRMVDMVSTTNEYIADVYRQVAPDVQVAILPNFVKAGMLDIVRPRPERVTIGWAGGTSHLIDMVEIQDVLRDVLTDEPDIDMHWVGFDFSPLLGALRHRCRRTNWTEDVGQYYKKVDFDIAIAPSADIPFNRSKTAIRALEMAALGIPIVAQNRLPYSEFVVDGKTGFLVDTPGEWYARLIDLIHDPAMRAELGANAKEQAAANTIEGNWPLWEKAYENAANA